MGTDAMIDADRRDADAIRYAVLRKLASGMRHALMGELQTIQFSAELAARMIDTGATGPKLDECIKQLPEQTRTAVNSCRAMIEWLRPDDKARAMVDETLWHCLKVAGDDWPLRGIVRCRAMSGAVTRWFPSRCCASFWSPRCSR